MILRYLWGCAPLTFFAEMFGLAGLADFLADFVLTATGAGFADECFGRAALTPLLTSAVSSSAALGMASAVALAQQNAAAIMRLATLRVRFFIYSFQFQSEWFGAASRISGDRLQSA